MCDGGLPLPSERVRVQHLQQQVIHRDHIFALHAQQMLHALITCMSDMGEQHQQIGQASCLLLGGDSALCNNPHQSICDHIEQVVQFPVAFGFFC